MDVQHPSNAQHFPFLSMLTTPVLIHQRTRERAAALKVSTAADAAAVDFYASSSLAGMVKHDAVE